MIDLHLEISRILEQITFRHVQPDDHTDRIRDMGYALDNTVLAIGDDERLALDPVLRTRAMSTPANALMIRRLVQLMNPQDIYLNVGTWHGFSFFAGCSVRERKSVGVDDFSQFGGPRDKFHESYMGSFEHPGSHFFDMDYRDFFATEMPELDAKIGLYFYDGAHDYDSQYDALVAAEPFLSDNAVILVDDINHLPARQATLAWVIDKHPEYAVVCDRLTATPGHPTFWNGLLVLQRRPVA